MENNTKVRISFKPITLNKDNSAGRTSSMKFTVNNGYPRIVVWINGPDRTVTGFDNMIHAPFDFKSFNVFLGCLKNVLNDDNGTTYEIKCFNAKWDRETNKRTDEIELVSTVIVGKDDKGVIYLAVVAENKPKIRFNLVTDSKWHIVTRNGTDITLNGVGSKMYATRFLKQLETNYDIVLESLKEKEDM